MADQLISLSGSVDTVPRQNFYGTDFEEINTQFIPIPRTHNTKTQNENIYKRELRKRNSNGPHKLDLFMMTVLKQNDDTSCRASHSSNYLPDRSSDDLSTNGDDQESNTEPHRLDLFMKRFTTREEDSDDNSDEDEEDSSFVHDEEPTIASDDELPSPCSQEVIDIRKSPIHQHKLDEYMDKVRATCSKKKEGVDELKNRHETVVTNGTPVCESSYDNEIVPKAHSELTEDVATCVQCGVYFNTYKAWKMHISTVHRNKCRLKRNINNRMSRKDSRHVFPKSNKYVCNRRIEMFNEASLDVSKLRSETAKLPQMNSKERLEEGINCIQQTNKRCRRDMDAQSISEYSTGMRSFSHCSPGKLMNRSPRIADGGNNYVSLKENSMINTNHCQESICASSRISDAEDNYTDLENADKALNSSLVSAYSSLSDIFVSEQSAEEEYGGETITTYYHVESGMD